MQQKCAIIFLALSSLPPLGSGSVHSSHFRLCERQRQKLETYNKFSLLILITSRIRLDYGLNGSHQFRFSFMSELHFLIQDIALQYVQIVEKAQINYLHSICLAEATVSTMHNANHALYSGMGPGPLRKNITHQFTKLTSIPSLKVITFSAFPVSPMFFP